MQLSVIIISYNTSLLLDKCLKALYIELRKERSFLSSEVIVVDNASKDDSVRMVRRKYPRVKILVNRNNLGFAKANNQGIRIAKGSYVLLLNSDTRIKKGNFRKLLVKLKENEQFGVIGGRLLNDDGSIQSSLGFFPHLFKLVLWMLFIDDLPLLTKAIGPYHINAPAFYKNVHEVDWVSGAFLLFKKSILGKAGYLDESLFMYAEEMEWCFRVKKAGYTVLYEPNAEIFHSKGGSSKEGVSAGIVKEFSGILHFYKKHKNKLEYLIAWQFLIFGALLRLILFGIIGRNPDKKRLYAQAFTLLRQ